MNSRSLLALALFSSSAVALHATDWPQYRGPNGDGTTPDKIATTWGAAPKVLWKVPGGTGFSSFAVAGNKCFVIEGEDKGGLHEVLVARDAATGKTLWSADLGAVKYQGGGDSGTNENKGGDGPRSSPTIVGNIVVAMHSDLALQAFDVASGKPLWNHDLMKEFAGRNVSWSNAASPLLEGGLLYVGGGGAGQSLLALDPKTGAVVAKGGDEKITHATPIVATILGQRQIIFYMQSGLVAVEPKTLKELWKAPVKYSVSTAASPVVAGDVVYASAGYGVGAFAFKISKDGAAWKAEQIMRVPGDRNIPNHWSTPVLYQGYLYGMFQFKKYGSGPVKAVKLPDGEIKWEKEGFGPGQAVLTNGSLLALSDAGELVLIPAQPDGYKELARAKVIDGKCWTTPVISNGLVFVRSTKEAACVDLRAK
jgi:outer membrane protein assembly factor BamB